MQKLINNEWIDCTEEDLIVGDIYRIPVGGGWQQQAYKIPVTPPIRVITKRSFMQRFDQAERILIRNSADDIVIDIYEDLKMASSVDLDLQDTIDAVNYLNENGYLTVKTVPELLADGTQAEQYP